MATASGLPPRTVAPSSSAAAPRAASGSPSPSRRSSPTPDRGFPKSDRIRRRGEYLAVQGAGRKLSTKSFLVFLEPTRGETSRLGITASKKVGGAVVRNRVKRLVREVFRRNKDRFPDRSLIVVVAKPQAAGLAYAGAEAELLGVFSRRRS